ncbi:alkyl sulfatase dimerization domain-containing protein [Streptomyces milbemycinicus]|uniref:alkyl sulfatase dimerization domain-containing protein n=1 Tax=Streptomyces milbemycinicus TaxID=476552 RepID=UPI0033C1B00E
MADTQGTPPEDSGLVFIPAEEVKSEDVSALTLDYQEGIPVLVAGSGTVIPAAVRVVNESGETVGLYTAAPVPQTRHAVPAVYSGYIGWFDGDPVALNPVPREPR